jgi:hypothetical protein
LIAGAKAQAPGGGNSANCTQFYELRGSGAASPPCGRDQPSPQLPKLWLSATSRMLSRPHRLPNLFLKIEFSFLNGILIVPPARRFNLNCVEAILGGMNTPKSLTGANIQ